MSPIRQLEIEMRKRILQTKQDIYVDALLELLEIARAARLSAKDVSAGVIAGMPSGSSVAKNFPLGLQGGCWPL